MNLIRRNSSFPSLRDEFFFPVQQHFDKFFEDFFKDANVDSVVASGNYPKMDVLTEGDEWLIKFAIPGVSPNDVSVEIVPGDTSTLVISGKMSEEHQSSEEARYYVRELKKSSFRKSITLPKWIEGDPEATFKDGMLKLAWKLPEETEDIPQVRKIEVKRE